MFNPLSNLGNSHMHCILIVFFRSLNFGAYRIHFMKAINGVSKIKDGYNAATWMLKVTTAAQEDALGVDFAEIYKNSDQFRSFEKYAFAVFGMTITYISSSHDSMELLQENQSFGRGTW